MSTDYARTREVAIRSADAAAASVLSVRPHYTEEEVLRSALVNAHHVILNQESTISRMRALIEEQRGQLDAHETEGTP